MSRTQAAHQPDESSVQDGHPTVVIDRSIPAQRWRWTCPNGHMSWAPTNAHVWCKGCRRQHEAGDDVDPEHYHLMDAKTGATVPYAAVEIVE